MTTLVRVTLPKGFVRAEHELTSGKGSLGWYVSWVEDGYKKVSLSRPRAVGVAQCDDGLWWVVEP